MFVPIGYVETLQGSLNAQLMFAEGGIVVVQFLQFVFGRLIDKVGWKHGETKEGNIEYWLFVTQSMSMQYLIKIIINVIRIIEDTIANKTNTIVQTQFWFWARVFSPVFYIFLYGFSNFLLSSFSKRR